MSLGLCRDYDQMTSESAHYPFTDADMERHYSDVTRVLDPIDANPFFNEPNPYGHHGHCDEYDMLPQMAADEDYNPERD
jgi:hypothetical protein